MAEGGKKMRVDDLFITEDISVLDAMRKLDETGLGVLFVAPEGVLRAVVTDGDIRRYILKSLPLEGPVREAANYSPYALPMEARARAKTALLEHGIGALPLLDKRGRVQDVVFAGGLDIDTHKKACAPVVIMAGGLGTRLYPYTKILPKPLIPIGEMPIVEHIIHRFADVGCSAFTMIVNYKKSMIKSYFNDLQKDYTVDYVDEDTPLGTGGGLSLLKGKVTQTFFLTNCDILIDADFGDIYQYHKEKGNVITMVCAVKHFTIPYGVVELGGDGDISGITEKPEMNFLTNTGVYVVEPSVIDGLAYNEPIPFTDIIADVRAAGGRVGVYPVSENSWIWASWRSWTTCAAVWRCSRPPRHNTGSRAGQGPEKRSGPAGTGRTGGNYMSVLIIAEAGVNHNGSLARAKKMALAAKTAGADIVKYQTAVPELVVSKFAEKAEYQKAQTGAGESQLEMVRRIHFGFDGHRELKAYCEEIGIEYLSTPFDLDSIDFLASLELPVYKIPSGEITNLPYLERIAALKKPVILSTGMSTLAEIEDAMSVLEDGGVEDITLLHCNTEYPTPFADANLRAMQDLASHFGCAVGYSDHTLGWEADIAAVALGACVIEKHFTLDKTLEGPDHKASLDPAELAAMVRAVRNTEQALGDGRKHVTSSEAKNKAIARKSIVARRAIAAGEAFTEENLTTKRPGDGVSPMRWHEVLGQTAKRAFSEDEKIEL